MWARVLLIRTLLIMQTGSPRGSRAPLRRLSPGRWCCQLAHSPLGPRPGGSPVVPGLGDFINQCLLCVLIGF